MGISRLLFFVSLLSIFATSIYAQEDDPGSNLQNIRESYLSFDAGPVLKNCIFLHWSNPDCHSHFQQSFLLRDTLTKQEQHMIGTFMVLENKEMGASPSIQRAIEYAERTGSLPVDGIELLNLYNGEMLTTDGFAEWNVADQLEQLAMIRRAVNPATGKVYSTFEAVEWEPFGIMIKKLEGDNAVMAMPFSATTSHGERVNEMRAYQGWQVTVYGKLPGSVLINKPIWREIKSSGPQKTGCGCKPKDSKSIKQDEETA